MQVLADVPFYPADALLHLAQEASPQRGRPRGQWTLMGQSQGISDLLVSSSIQQMRSYTCTWLKRHLPKEVVLEVSVR